MDPATMALLASLGIQGGNMLFNMFKKPEKSPANAAMPYLEKIPGTIKPYLDPYVQQGQSAYNMLNPIYGNMAQDPAGYLEKMMGGYKQSKGYELQKDEALKAATATAAAGGRRGTPEDMMNQARIAEMLQGQDMQQWLNNAMGIQGMGLQGQQGFYDTGYRASSDLASDLANILGTQASLSFQGQSQKNQSSQDLTEQIMKALAGMTGSISGFDWNKNTGNNFKSNPMGGNPWDRYNLGIKY